MGNVISFGRWEVPGDDTQKSDFFWVFWVGCFGVEKCKKGQDSELLNGSLSRPFFWVGIG